jgi:hypothetical protein
MIRVEFTRPTPPDAFNEWVRRCEERNRKMKSAADVSESLYKEQRAHFLSLFNGKCAYCEAKIILDQHQGDVEHFRPKGKVTDENDQTIQIEDGKGKSRPHPGYFWLAHDWRNLLPACIACNRPALLPNGERVGKWERFPVKGKHATTPAELAREKPLLLNPLDPDDDPAKHLVFDPDTGRIIARTERGKMCVKVFNLNREGLPEARRDVYDAVRARTSQIIAAEMDDDLAKMERHLEFILQHKEGRAEYSIAGRPAVDRYMKALRRQSARLLGAADG